MHSTPRIQFLIPVTAGRPTAGEELVFSYEEIKSGSVQRIGPAMVLCPGMGCLRLGFEVPGNEPLAADPFFRIFAKKLIRLIPSPFFALSLDNDALKLLFLCTLENLEIERRAGEAHARISADSEEYSSLFTEEASRLRTVLTANGGMEQYQPRIEVIGEYYAE